MSWKSRKRKAFFRYVELLKELPIYLVDQYILIDESVCYYKKYKMHVDYQVFKKAQYKKYSLSGKIKSSFDFDNFFNPDLTLNAPFEKNPSKATAIVKNSLSKIGNRWAERLKDRFPDKSYTVVMYFNSEDQEWYLDFYNGTVKIEEFDHSGQCRDIVYLCRNIGGEGGHEGGQILISD